MTRKMPPTANVRNRTRTDPLADLDAPETETAAAQAAPIDPPQPTEIDSGFQRIEDMANDSKTDAHIWDKMSSFDTLDILSNPVMLACQRSRIPDVRADRGRDSPRPAQLSCP